jgi:energy-coupling factor transporter ATP-binding protein EcfA2
VIREIEIEGFKSIERLKLELGRVTVLIGENGCGKSNILEAIAFASAAHADRLGHEFLASRGIRSTEPKLMRPAFPTTRAVQMRVTYQAPSRKPTTILFSEDASSTVPVWSGELGFIGSDGKPSGAVDTESKIEEILDKFFEENPEASSTERPALVAAVRAGMRAAAVAHLLSFLVYSPENSALRTFEREGQILPIGINGEGLFAHLRALDRMGKNEVLGELNRRLGLIDWFSGFDIPADLGPGEHRLNIRDRYLSSDVLLDQRSANEGFLFLLFYFTLLLSPDTPRFFAVDNIDASLNPRLCARLMKDVVELAKVQDRQVVVTTHNPAVLDGLDLKDDEQRLVVVSRTQSGTTRVRRVRAPEPIEGAPPLRLSEAFIQGFLGGLPDNF